MFREENRLVTLRGGAVASLIAPVVAKATCAAIGVGTAGAGGIACLLIFSGFLVAELGDVGAATGENLGESFYERTTQ